MISDPPPDPSIPLTGTPGPAAPDRRLWLYGAVAAAAALAGAGLSWRQRAGAPDAAASIPAFWDMGFQTPDNAALPMRSFLGKPLLLNFWATWCPPCVEELPLLDRFYQENSRNAWQVLGLAVDQPTAVNTFLARAPLHFPVALAGMAGIDLSKTLGNLSGALPFTVVLGSSGQLLHRKMGRVTEDDLASWRVLR